MTMIKYDFPALVRVLTNPSQWQILVREDTNLDGG